MLLLIYERGNGVNHYEFGFIESMGFECIGLQPNPDDMEKSSINDESDQKIVPDESKNRPLT